MSVGIEDKTGQPPADREVDEALAVVEKWIVKGMVTLPPELAVQLPNIRRCLQDLKRMRGLR